MKGRPGALLLVALTLSILAGSPARAGDDPSVAHFRVGVRLFQDAAGWVPNYRNP